MKYLQALLMGGKITLCTQGFSFSLFYVFFSNNEHALCPGAITDSEKELSSGKPAKVKIQHL